MSSAVLNIGIAGLGRMGRRHAEQMALRELGMATVVDDFAALLRDPQVQAVAIITPTTLHAEQTIAALEAAKHVFVAKPLALEVATTSFQQ